MAANEYYNVSPSQGNGRRYAAHPPHLSLDPYATYSSHPTQPSPPHISSPFEDTSYRPYADRSQQSTPSAYYASGGGGRETEPNPYSDDIPLRQHPSKGSSEILRDPLPHDPAIIDRPSQNAARRRRKRGFFGGKVPWVVYTLTLIQVCVFIAELVKNGESCPFSAFRLRSDVSRRPYENPNRNTPILQPYDWPLPLCPHQHGRSLCSLYAPDTSRSGHDHLLAVSKHDNHLPRRYFQSMSTERTLRFPR